MASESFTRDEVILALDVLYSSENGRVSADSDEIRELSLLLNRLPIHPAESRRAYFRSPNGITAQLMRFRSCFSSGKRGQHVGNSLFDIALEYENKTDELHSIARAIRKNESAFVSPYGSPLEDIGFPEGVLLGHLHSIIEQRDGAKAEIRDYCEVCSIRPAICYRNSGQLLQNHLTVAPTAMDYAKKYRAESFLTVCPTCHAALHRCRPWLTKENCGDILR
ncbi:MAG: hypothetical protein LUH40_00555 [Clostridiales bacterium]|nr:hypothetical protein [Clostridiales bacterium]